MVFLFKTTWTAGPSNSFLPYYNIRCHPSHLTSFEVADYSCGWGISWMGDVSLYCMVLVRISVFNFHTAFLSWAETTSHISIKLLLYACIIITKLFIRFEVHFRTLGSLFLLEICYFHDNTDTFWIFSTPSFPYIDSQILISRTLSNKKLFSL